MIDLNKIPESILNDIRENHSEYVEEIPEKVDNDLSRETVEELFGRYCDYNGLINWSSRLIQVLDLLREAEIKTAEFGSKEIKLLIINQADLHKLTKGEIIGFGRELSIEAMAIETPELKQAIIMAEDLKKRRPEGHA